MIYFDNGFFKLDLTHSGEGDFTIKTYSSINPEGKVILSKTGNYSGTILLKQDSENPSGKYNTRYEIISSGSWTFDIRKVRNEIGTSKMSGSGDKVTKYILPSNPGRISISNVGQGEFLVQAIAGVPYDLCKGNGNVNCNVVDFLSSYKHFLVIKSSGDWTIDYNRGDELTEY